MKTRSALVACVCLVSMASMLASLAAWAKGSLPAPVKALEAQGMSIAGGFKAPGGLSGYAASYQGQAVAVYVTPDGRHAIVGTLIGPNGNNLSNAPLNRLITYPKNRKAWNRLKHSTWIGYGSEKAPTVIYLFIDPNCPYCHAFLKEARPWVKAGKVQIRNVLVAVLRPSSLPKAAAILASKHPAKALVRNENNYGSGGIQPEQNVSGKIADKIRSNNQLMNALGIQATPAIYYHGANGHVASTQGLPRGKRLTQIMGSPSP